MSEPLHFKLKSGRVFILDIPFTPEELAEANTPAGMAFLEEIADAFENRPGISQIDSESTEGRAMLKQHGIQP